MPLTALQTASSRRPRWYPSRAQNGDPSTSGGDDDDNDDARSKSSESAQNSGEGPSGNSFLALGGVGRSISERGDGDYTH